MLRSGEELRQARRSWQSQVEIRFRRQQRVRFLALLVPHPICLAIIHVALIVLHRARVMRQQAVDNCVCDNKVVEIGPNRTRQTSWLEHGMHSSSIPAGLKEYGKTADNNKSLAQGY